MAELSVATGSAPRRARAGGLRTIRSAVLWGLTLLAVAVALLLALGTAAGLKPLVVLTGSMRPAIQPGDLLVVRQMPAGRIERGQIVTFARPGRPGETLTHRVVSVADNGGNRRSVVTRGDANDRGERWTIAGDGTVGRYLFKLPDVGRLANAVATPTGRTVAIWLLAAALIAQILWTLWRPRRDPS
jgi:signal peptidase I